MVNRSNLIGQTDTGRLSALGSVTQRDYNYIKSILNDEEMLRYFAEPSLSDNNEKIDWYTQVEGRAKSFNDLNRQEANRTTEELNKLMLKLAEKAKATNNTHDYQTIMNLTKLPDTDSIKLVGDQVTIINWSYQLHKSQNQKQQTGGFAGLVSPPDIPQPIINEELEVTNGTETLQAPASPPDLNATGPEPQPDKPVADPIKPDPEPDTVDKQTEAPVSRGLLYNKWFWLVVFLCLLVFNLLMMKDACGVRNIPFLYFC